MLMFIPFFTSNHFWDNWSVFTGKQMGLFSHIIDRRQLNPGDHIYSWRQGYLYAHHGIFVGEGKVIHFTRGADQEKGKVLDRLNACSSSLSSHPTGISCPTCGEQTKTDGVISSCLDCFLDWGDLYRFEYGFSYTFFLTRARGDTCTTAFSDLTEDVLRRARFLLDNGFGCYNAFKNNCIDFAIYCKTGFLVLTNIGVCRSGKAASIVSGASAVASLALRFNLYGCAFYCGSRLACDIGIRSDKIKVAVEKIAEMVREG